MRCQPAASVNSHTMRAVASPFPHRLILPITTKKIAGPLITGELAGSTPPEIEMHTLNFWDQQGGHTTNATFHHLMNRYENHSGNFLHK